MLIEIIERRSSVTNRKSVVYILECEACGKRNEGCKCRYERSKMHFCDNKCRGKYKHDHPETWQKAIQALNSPESHAKSRASIQERAARGEWRHWLGKHHTEETRKHLSEVSKGGKRAGENNGMFGRKHKESSKDAMSDAKTKLIIEGKFQPGRTGHKKGWYESTKTNRKHFFRSSWEEAVMKWLDASEVVTVWDYECVRIPYRYGIENRQRWYVPDFIVSFWGGETEMWEVKPKEFHSTERVLRTSEAGRKYCAENNIASYVLIDKDGLIQRGIL